MIGDCPVADTEKLAVLPAHSVDATGWVAIAVAGFTVKLADDELIEPHPPVTATE